MYPRRVAEGIEIGKIVKLLMKITELVIRNYRTLEKIHLKFSHSYTTICGPNDCGKTNVVRVIRSVMRDRDSYFYRDIEDINVKDNYPKWKHSDTGDRTIQISFKISINQDFDVGLFQFIHKQLSLEKPPENLTCEISVVHLSDKPEPQVSVEVEGRKVDGLDAQQVLKSLRSAQAVLFHNSTRTEGRFLRSGKQGFLSELSGESQAHFDSMKKSVDRTLKKVARKHQQQIEELIGRLEAKYRVGLSLPDFDLSYLPYNITLGQKHLDVPLDDWGSGTQNRTMILMTLLRARQISQSEASASKVTPIIIIEEPESFLHPSAQAEFGRILQDLADEFQIQVIVTTHSPYLLSKSKPASNILLKRSTEYGQLRETQVVDT